MAIMSTQLTHQIKATANFQKATADTWKNTADSTIETTEKTVHYFDEATNAFAQFYTNQIESWFATFKKAN